ncbi:RTKN2 [Cordylochernes scorpioides]|uniref:RTKN2 n=1 Tax=Cordylochernes scorpioides TaxID=51811 RepID=A0ABY6KLN8_9ARAC|nr:RTKN2 [Cordylochernes scorpioides]
MEVYSCLLQNDLSIASTPRKLKKRISSSLSRTLGRKAAAGLSGERFDLVARASLKLADSSPEPHAHDLLLENLENAHHQLPLFGYFCCRLAVRPHCLEGQRLTGPLLLVETIPGSHHYTPESKQQSKQWTGPGERAPKKAKTCVSRKGDSHCLLRFPRNNSNLLLGNGKNNNRRVLYSTLDRLKEELRAKWKFFFHHDNAPPLRSNVSAAKFFELGFQLVSHPPYSPDFVPCDFFLSPYLKQWLGRGHFHQMKIYRRCKWNFEDLETSNFSEGIKIL